MFGFRASPLKSRGSQEEGERMSRVLSSEGPDKNPVKKSSVPPVPNK